MIFNKIFNFLKNFYEGKKRNYILLGSTDENERRWIKLKHFKGQQIIIGNAPNENFKQDLVKELLVQNKALSYFNPDSKVDVEAIISLAKISGREKDINIINFSNEKFDKYEKKINFFKDGFSTQWVDVFTNILQKKIGKDLDKVNTAMFLSAIIPMLVFIRDTEEKELSFDLINKLISLEAILDLYNIKAYFNQQIYSMINMYLVSLKNSGNDVFVEHNERIKPLKELLNNFSQIKTFHNKKEEDSISDLWKENKINIFYFGNLDLEIKKDLQIFLSSIVKNEFSYTNNSSPTIDLSIGFIFNNCFLVDGFNLYYKSYKLKSTGMFYFYPHYAEARIKLGEYGLTQILEYSPIKIVSSEERFELKKIWADVFPDEACFSNKEQIIYFYKTKYEVLKR